MKKLLSIVLATALLISLFAVMAHAEDTNLAFGRNVETAISEGNANLDLGFWDKNYLTDGMVPEFPSDDQDRLGWYAGSPTKSTYLTVSIDLGALCSISRVVLIGQKFLAGANIPNTFDVNLSVDGNTWTKIGGEVGREGECESITYETSMDARYLLITITEMPNVADATNYYCGFGEIEVYGTAKEEQAPSVTYSDKQLGNGAAVGVWLKAGNPTSYVEFTTAGGVKGLKFPIYWASRPEVDAAGNEPTGPSANWTVEVFEFDSNPENTLSKAPVKSEAITSVADNNPAFVIEWDEALPAGTYIVRFTVNNADYVDDNNKSPYLVLPLSDIEVADASKAAYDRENQAFTIIVRGEDIEGEYFLANPENTDTPAQPTTDEPQTQPATQQPQTGDASVAMIAVLVVLAMGAAVVFARKKSH